MHKAVEIQKYIGRQFLFRQDISFEFLPNVCILQFLISISFYTTFLLQITFIALVCITAFFLNKTTIKLLCINFVIF